MVDTCSKVIVGNEGYSKAALRQMLGNMLDMFQSTGEVDIPALGNFLNQLVDTMPDPGIVQELDPGTVSPPDIGGEELGDEGLMRVEYSTCPDYVEEYPYASCAFSCGTAMPTPKRMRIWVNKGVAQYYTNLPLLRWDGVAAPCRPPTWQFITIVESDCTLVTETAALDVANLLYANDGSLVGFPHTNGTPWSSSDLDTLAQWVEGAANGVNRIENALIRLIRDLSDYYDFEQYGWCTPPDYG